jgi:hypothetical protein
MGLLPKCGAASIKNHMEQVIDSATNTNLLSKVEASIAEWQTALTEAAAAQEETKRLREEVTSADVEESSIIADGSLSEGAAAKKLSEIRARKELKLARLQTAERNLGSAGLVLNRKELAELESQAVQLEADIKIIDEEERAIFARGNVPDVQAGRRLSDIRPRREVKEAKLKTILDRLASQRGGLKARAIEAAEEAQRQLESLVKQLIRKREQAVLRLLGYLCDEDDLARHRWKHYPMDFKSVNEAVRLRRFSCSDPSEARALFEQISALWDFEPLAGLLKACEQSD